MSNAKLSKAKNAKFDEFYTQYYDIENELKEYFDYDSSQFQGKTVLLPCDDPEWSNFTRYFAQNFERLGLKKLISTSYAPESRKYKYPQQLSLFEEEAPQFDPQKSKVRGKIFVLDRDVSGDGRVNLDDMQWDYLEGDGDFRSDEVRHLRDDADIIVTNPPFSLFREYFSWVMESNKKFLMIANKLCFSYKDVFSYVMDGKLWADYRRWSGGMWFETKRTEDIDKVVDGVSMKNVPTVWITNLEHGRRHEPLQLMTIEQNLKHSKHKEIRGKIAYDHYDNYDAIEVPFTDAIPSDYEGAMGVPITFMEKFCPEQFEIIGNEYIMNISKGRCYVKGKRLSPRLFIRKLTNL